MGGYEYWILVQYEPSLGYHPSYDEVLTHTVESQVWTLPGGQFDWGGRLPKSNGGAQRSPQGEWKSPDESVSV